MRARCSTSSVDLGIVKKSGAWFTYEGEQLGQGRENAKNFLVENLEMMVEISEKVLHGAGLEPTSTRTTARTPRAADVRSPTATTSPSISPDMAVPNRISIITLGRGRSRPGDVVLRVARVAAIVVVDADDHVLRDAGLGARAVRVVGPGRRRQGPAGRFGLPGRRAGDECRVDRGGRRRVRRVARRRRRADGRTAQGLLGRILVLRRDLDGTCGNSAHNPYASIDDDGRLVIGGRRATDRRPRVLS